MAKPDKGSPRMSVTIAALWRSLVRDLFESYRPELHYMRGPGPKWHAKHRPQTQAPAVTGLVDASV